MYKIEIKKSQILDKDGNPITIICDNGKAIYRPGTNPDVSWYDITSDVESKDKIDIIFDSLEKNGIAKVTDLVVLNAGFNIIKDWIYCSPCSHLNSFDVRLTHDKCKVELDNFLIKADNLTFCEDDGCKITVSLRAENKAYRCLCSTTMYDNHQNWFNGENTANAKEFPAFQVALEKDGAGAKLGVQLFYQSFPTLALVNGIVDLFNDRGIDILNTSKTVLESLGLDNFAVAPPIWELIDNIAAKCGLGTDTFFHVFPYSLDCWLEAPGGKYHKPTDNDNTVAENCWFFQDNISYRTPKEFFDILAKRYNAEWKIEGGKIVFKKLTDTIDDPPIIDFEETAEDICYEFSGESKPACYRLEYATEDCASSQINGLYSNLAKWDKDNENQLLEGIETESLEVAATGFVRDGTTSDYMRLAMRQGLASAFTMVIQLSLTIAALLAPPFLATPSSIALVISTLAWATVLIAKYKSARKEFTEWESQFTGVIRICNQDNINVPRIIRWNGVRPKSARVLFKDNPAPRTDCNTIPYKGKHSVNADDGNPSNNLNNTGRYRAFNYAHYFDQDFQNNAYDEHEPTKNPNNNYEGNQLVNFKACQDCNDLTLLGVFKGQTVALGKYVRIKTDECFGNRVKITKIRLFEGYTYITGKIFRR